MKTHYLVIVMTRESRQLNMDNMLQIFNWIMLSAKRGPSQLIKLCCALKRLITSPDYNDDERYFENEPCFFSIHPHSDASALS